MGGTRPEPSGSATPQGALPWSVRPLPCDS
jgi:hypothetical protein